MDKTHVVLTWYKIECIYDSRYRKSNKVNKQQTIRPSNVFSFVSCIYQLSNKADCSLIRHIQISFSFPTFICLFSGQMYQSNPHTASHASKISFYSSKVQSKTYSDILLSVFILRTLKFCLIAEGHVGCLELTNSYKQWS